MAFGFGILAPLAGAIDVTSEMRQANQRAQCLAGELIARAHRAGLLRANVSTMDISLLIGQFGRTVPAPPGQSEEGIRSRLLTIALDGLKAHNTGSLPGEPPSVRHYQAPWDT
ncbi:hypothetical protein [Nonomuraea sp. GTA35]|uniref:SbtR family transcriptional regulator n=1 Tax=Nonomuraea sp. GTA35 TaxID=1676746 RepID=UPI0035BFB269